MTQVPDSQQQTAPLAAAVTPKIPPFWSSDVELWFAQVEGQFETSNSRTEKTKFSHLVGALPHDAAKRVRNLILRPDATSPYTKLKEALILQYTPSYHNRLQQALTIELGDMKPTLLLATLQQFLPAETSDSHFLKDLFLQKMPIHIRPVLTSMTSTPLDAMAVSADALIDLNPEPAPQVIHNVNSQSQFSTPAPLSNQDEIPALRAEIQAIRRQMGTAQPHESQGQNMGVANSGDEICWYHRRFGNKARACKQPCRYSKNDNPRR